MRGLARLRSAIQFAAFLLFACAMGWVAGSLIVADVEAALAKPRAAYASQPAQYWQPLPDSMYVYEDTARGAVCYRYKDNLMSCVR